MRGRNRVDKRSLFKHLIQQWGVADIYVLIETKLEGADSN